MGLFIVFPVLIYLYTDKWVVRRFIEAGVVIPVLLIIVKYVELGLNSQEVPLASLYGFYVWPSSFFLMAIHGDSWTNYLFLIWTIILNALLYSLIGYTVVLALFAATKWRHRGISG